MNLKYLTESRKSTGFTKAEVSRYLGVTGMALTQWERGETVPRLDNLIKLCKLLNMDANILLGLKGEIE
ncbi:MAG: helix-turn-helix domain-containing protein [Cetobacterium sp.]